MSGRRAKALRRLARAEDPGAPSSTINSWYKILKAEYKGRTWR